MGVFRHNKPTSSSAPLHTKDRASMKKMILGFSYFGFIYTLIYCVLGLMAALLIPGLDLPDNAMPMLLKQVPASISVVVFVSIMAAAVSTMNSIVLTLSNMFGRDLLKAFYPELSEEKELAFSKIVIVVLIAACLLFAQLRLDLIVVLSSLASGGLLVQLPSVWGAFFWRKATAKGAMASILFGGVTVGFLTPLTINFWANGQPCGGFWLHPLVYPGKPKDKSAARLNASDDQKEEMLAKF